MLRFLLFFLTLTLIIKHDTTKKMQQETELKFNGNCLLCQENKDCIMALECGHVLCVDCVVCLIEKRSRKCPFCRTVIRWTKPQIKQCEQKI